MESIIVEICLAATHRVVDFALPAHVPLEVMLEPLVEIVEQVYQELTYQGGEVMLFDLATKTAIPKRLTLAQAGVHDGHRLLLI